MLHCKLHDKKKTIIYLLVNFVGARDITYTTIYNLQTGSDEPLGERKSLRTIYHSVNFNV